MLGPKFAETNIQKLVDIPVQRPKKAKSFWKGVSHYEMVDAVYRAAEIRGFTVEMPRYNLSRNDCDMVFSCVIDDPKTTTINNTWGKTGLTSYTPAFGMVYSNCMRRGLGFYAGLYARGDKLGSLTLFQWRGRKLGGHFDVTTEIEGAMKEWSKLLPKIINTVYQLQREFPTDDEIRELLHNSAVEKLMPWSRIGRVDKFFARQKGQHKFDLLVAFSQMTNMNPPMIQMDQQFGFYKMVAAKKVGVAVS